MFRSPQKILVLKPCSHRQLAKAYGVSEKILRRWLSPYQETKRPAKTKYSLTQLLFIIEKIGPPVHPFSG